MAGAKFDAERSLDTFLSRIPHDFNAPISSLSGLIDMGRKLTDEPGVLRIFDMQEKVLDRAQALIRDVMDISNIRKHHTSTKPSNLLFVLKDAIHACEKEIEGVSNIEFQFPKEDESWEMDQYLSQNVFENITRNAILHSLPKTLDFQPSIKFRTEVTPKRKAIFITDNGHGIPEEVQDSIFDMFTVGNTRVVGSGLGLFKAQLAMEMQNGTIRLIESRPGYTEFAVEFPL
jgi:signal transduction histidine kinase